MPVPWRRDRPDSVAPLLSPLLGSVGFCIWLALPLLSPADGAGPLPVCDHAKGALMIIVPPKARLDTIANQDFAIFVLLFLFEYFLILLVLRS
jgi:hypothetical protein